MTTASVSIEDQIELEVTQVTDGVDRYRQAKAKAEERNRDLDGGPMARLLLDMMAALEPSVIDLQKKCHEKVKTSLVRGVRLGGWELAVDALSADVMAYITCRTILSMIDRSGGDGVQAERYAIGLQIGTAVNYQFRWDKAQRAERTRLRGDDPEPSYNRLNRMRRTVKEINPRSVRKWLKKIDDLEANGLGRKELINLGVNMLALVHDTLTDFIVAEKVRLKVQGRIRDYITTSLTPEVTKRLKEAHVVRSRAMPWLKPMICEPLDWKWIEGEGYVGGYYRTPQLLVKEGRFRHTGRLVEVDCVPEVNLRALNALQRTAWRVDSGMLKHAMTAVEAGHGDLLPVGLERDLPESVPAKVWAKMTREERHTHAHERRLIHDHNNKLRAKREGMFRILDMAADFAPCDRIYFPHNLDFRGRAYPLPQDLHPQSDDFGRSLLTFAEGKPLGRDGLRWLMYHTANTYGMDKASREEQFDWVQAHSTQIAYIARDPFDPEVSDFLRAAEEPWQFIAACRELDAALASGDPASFVSHLPVQIDGSCNGLQHLSAMGLDPVGAAATNLTPGPRQDVYQQVADKVAERVFADASVTNPHHGGKTFENKEAIAWVGHVTRKTVKRGVMTYPYGLTKIGMRDQLMSDGFCDGLGGDQHDNATYLTGVMMDAIEGTVIAAADVMEWLQFNAKQLAEADRPCEWTTPTGFRVQQRYVQLASRRIITVVGRAMIYMEEEGAPIVASKQATSIAPNVIHSFDAAHMYLTIDALADRGMAFSMIHDSYGTHAADMDALLDATRETFVEIYSHDWMHSIQAEFQAIAGDDVELAPPPARGDFDVRQVLNSNFFFA